MIRFLAALFLAAASQAAAAFSGSIVDAAFVAKAIARGAIVWDIRSTEAYFDGHLPGAVNASVTEALLDEKTQQFLPIERIDANLRAAGLDLKREIVVYGSPASAYAYFAQFALEYFGARRVHVFHQGLPAWRAAKQKISTAAVKPRPVKVRPFANPAMLVTTGEVLARIGSADVQFLDVRRAGEFRGDESETLHGGHIPGAIHIPYNQALVDPDAPRKMMMKETVDLPATALKKRRELKKLYAALDPKKEVIVYCHTGIRAAMTASVLASLGFHSVRLYLASWYEYGNQTDAPVEQ